MDKVDVQKLERHIDSTNRQLSLSLSLVDTVYAVFTAENTRQRQKLNY